MKQFSYSKSILSSLAQEPQTPSEEPTEPNRHIPESEPYKPSEVPIDPNRHAPEQIPVEPPTMPNPNIPEFPITR